MVPVMLTAVVGIPACLLALRQGGWVWTAWTVVLAVVFLAEWQRSFREAGRPFLPLAAYAGTVAGLLGLAWLPEAAQGPAAFAAVWVILFGTVLAALWRFPGESLIDGTGGTLLMTFYVLAGLAALLLLPRLEGPGFTPWGARQPWPAGLRWCLLALLCTWGGEGGATLISRFRSRRSEAADPASTARHTWEGTISGWVLAALLGSLLGFFWLGLTGWSGFLVGGLCGLLTSLGNWLRLAIWRDLGDDHGDRDAPVPQGAVYGFHGLLIALPATYFLALLLQ